jgi:hypothetical protein
VQLQLQLQLQLLLLLLLLLQLKSEIARYTGAGAGAPWFVVFVRSSHCDCDGAVFWFVCVYVACNASVSGPVRYSAPGCVSSTQHHGTQNQSQASCKLPLCNLG